MAHTDDRVAVLEELVELRVPVAAARAKLSGFAWDEDELVTLTTQHVMSVLERVRDGEVQPDEAEAWADSIHLRDDVAREPGREDLINHVLIQMSSPELFGALSTIGSDLLMRLRQP
jgi:hypothetical protein